MTAGLFIYTVCAVLFGANAMMIPVHCVGGSRWGLVAALIGAIGSAAGMYSGVN
jgi:hypothetical protein